MKNELIKLADHLDRKGLHKEADYIDTLVKKAFSSPVRVLPLDPYGIGEEGGLTRPDWQEPEFTNVGPWTASDFSSIEEAVAKANELGKKLEDCLPSVDDLKDPGLPA